TLLRKLRCCRAAREERRPVRRQQGTGRLFGAAIPLVLVRRRAGRRFWNLAMDPDHKGEITRSPEVKTAGRSPRADFTLPDPEFPDTIRPIVVFDGVSKWYDNVIGINKLTLRIPSGVTGLLGPNGAGKSTLLQLATGQLRPSQGVVRVLGHIVWNNPALNRRLGLCPEPDAFYEWMTGWHFVYTCARLSGLTRAAARPGRQERDRLEPCPL